MTNPAESASALADAIRLQPGQPGYCWPVGILAFGICAIFLLSTGRLALPPGSGWHDDVIYENISWCLASGQGFSQDWRSPEWRQPYFEGYRPDQIEWFARYRHHGPTANRYPGFPLLAAGIYRTMGRDFAAVRIMNGLFMSGAIALAVVMAYRIAGIVAAACVNLTILFDWAVTSVATEWLTEPLATFLFMATFGTILMALARPGYRYWVGAGILLGLLILTRSVFLLWVPGLVMVWVVWKILDIIRPPPTLHGSETGAAEHSGALVRRDIRWGRRLVVLLAISAIVVAPWAIRNCRVTGAFEPLGCLGKLSLAGAYCDEALAEWGNWQVAPQVEIVHRSTAAHRGEELTLAEYECVHGQYGTTAATEWCRANPGSIPGLMLMRVCSHLNLRRLPNVSALLYMANLLLLSCAAAGAFMTRHTLFGRVFFVVLVIDLIVVALTWSHYGRFLIPLRPLIHVSAAVVLAVVVQLDLAILRHFFGKRNSASGNAG